MMPGKNPASATPSSARMIRKLVSPATNAMAAAISPQVTMIRASHLRAPTLTRIAFDGVSHSILGEEQDTGAEAEDRRREPEVGVHLQRGEADIGAVEEVEEIAKHQERDQTTPDPSHGVLFQPVHC